MRVLAPLIVLLVIVAVPALMLKMWQWANSEPADSARTVRARDSVAQTLPAGPEDWEVVPRANVRNPETSQARTRQPIQHRCSRSTLLALTRARSNQENKPISPLQPYGPHGQERPKAMSAAVQLFIEKAGFDAQRFGRPLPADVTEEDFRSALMDAQVRADGLRSLL